MEETSRELAEQGNEIWFASRQSVQGVMFPTRWRGGVHAKPYQARQVRKILAACKLWLLKGTAAFGLNEDVVLTRIHIVGTKPSPDKRPNSLAEAVFHKQGIVSVDDVTKPPANQEDRVVLGLKPGTSAMGLPLFVGKKFLGVMLVYSDDTEHPMGQRHAMGQRHDDILKPYADICALALSIAQAKESLFSRAEILKTHAAIARHFGKISVNPSIVLTANLDEIARGARKEFAFIVKHAVRLLRADLGALYLADQPVCLKSNDPDDIDKEYLNGTRQFTLRAMHSYPNEALDHTTYTPGETAITASVLRRLEPRRSPDVQREKDWSQKGAGDFKRLFAPSGGLRAWMGVPIVFEHANHQYLFGAITFTRGRECRDDKMAFTESDEELAVALARLLALALQSLNVARMELVTRERESLLSVSDRRSRTSAICSRMALLVKLRKISTDRRHALPH